MKIWGSHVYVVDTNVTRTKLDNRTHVGVFMKFSSTTKVIVYYNPRTRKFGQTSHAYFDELRVGISVPKIHTNTIVPGNKLISSFPNNVTDMNLSEVQSNLHNMPILQEPAITYGIILPPIDCSCPIKFYDDDTYRLPYIKNMPQSSPIGQQLPLQALKQQWILHIGNEEPIHAASAHDELTRLRTTHANRQIQITMAPRVIDTCHKYEHERSKFDQMRPVLASVFPTTSSPNIDPSSSSTSRTNNIILPMSHTTINNNHILPSDTNNIMKFDIAGNLVPTISVLVHSSTKPSVPNNIQDCFLADNPLRTFWIQTIYEQYDKNASYRVFTRPISKTSIPSETLILKSVLAPTVKPTDINALWKLNIRHCVNGRPMKGLSEYGATRASTVHPDTVRFQLAYATSLGFTHRTYDCTNAFQCTFEDDPTKRI